MKRTDPPFLAAWMLEHWTPGGCNHALAGDLREVFRSGRSNGWYWRQVLSALAIDCAREVRVHYAALLFAALWSTLAPAWLLSVAGLERYLHLSDHFSTMDWPWSTLSDLGVILASNLLFLWAGILLFLLPDLWLTGNLGLRALARGVGASWPALFVLWLALIALPKHFVAAQLSAQVEATGMPTSAEILRYEQRRIRDRHDGAVFTASARIESESSTLPEISLHDAMTDTRRLAVLVRLPFFLVVLCTLWSAASRTKRYAS